MRAIMSDFPYPGLRPFRRDETDIFFGREEQVDQLLERLDGSRFLAVVGPSGCGKSSLVQAGLFAALEIGFLVSAGVRWRTAKTRPGTCPLRNLARALVKESALGPERGGDAEPERGGDAERAAFLLATLRRGPLGLIEALSMTPLPEGTNLLILVDQFEEIFRYRKQYSLDEAQAFVALLLASARQKAIPVYVVITMRSDFLGDCALFSGLPEAIDEGQFLTPRLSREQCRAAIVGPAEVFGGEVEPVLVNRLLNDMGTDSEQLPLFQHALMRMWREAGKRTATPSPVLTLDDYKTIGGMESALSKHADEAFNELDEKQKLIAEVLFRSLSERSETQRDTRRPSRLSEIAAVAGVTSEQVAAVVDVYRRPGRSFLTPPAGIPLEAETIIDISHESLIRLWKRLNTWVAEEADSADIYCRLEQTARLWQSGKAELWGKLDLENALAWEKRQHPTREWAMRYGCDFDLVMQFLDESKKLRDEEKRRAEEAHYRELRQTKKRLALTTVGLIIALSLFVWACWERGHARKAAESARKAESRARQTEKQRTHDLFESYLTHASLLAKNEDYRAARRVLNQIRVLDSEISAERRHARDLMLWFVNLMGGRPKQVYCNANAPLLHVAVSSDRRWLAAVGFKGTVVLFDAKGRGAAPRCLRGLIDNIWGVVFHPDGNWLATAGEDKHIIFWTLPDGERLKEWRAPDKVFSLALSPDGSRLASCGDDRNVTIWNVKTGKILQTLQGHRDAIYGLAFSPDGSLLASASMDNTARIWDLKTGKARHILHGHTDEVNHVAFHPNGEILATCSNDTTIRLWDVRTGKLIRVLQGHKRKVFDIEFVNLGRHLVSASLDSTLRIWDTDLGVTLRLLQGHSGYVYDIAVMGNHLFSSSSDGTLCQWEIPPEGTLESMRIVDLPGEPISCAIAPDSYRVAVGFADGGLRLYRLPDVRLLWENAQAHTSEIKRLDFSPDGQNLASASLDTTVSLWRTSDGRLKQTFTGHRKGIHAVAFSPDGRQVATASLDGQIGIFEIGREIGRFYSAHEGGAYSVVFDPGGQRLLSAGEDGRTCLWDMQTWPPTQLQDSPRFRNSVYWAAISPDGRHLASGGLDQTVKVMRIIDGSIEHILPGHEYAVCRIAFSPDGGQIATIGADATVRLWDLSSGSELFTLRLSPTVPWPPLPWDFDFRCTSLSGGGCWIAVPLRQGKLVLYNLGQIYDKAKR
jgi:WD40 repeat protein